MNDTREVRLLATDILVYCCYICPVRCRLANRSTMDKILMEIDGKSKT